MSSTSIKTPQQKANQESFELQNETNADLREDVKKDSGKESENEKPQNLEVVINIDESVQDNMKNGSSNKDFLLYECRSNPVPRRKVPTTLVYYANIGQYIEPGENPLEYTPDRNRFVRLVMIMVFIMSSTTAVCVAIVFNVEELKEFCQDNGLLMAVVGMVTIMGTTYAMACSMCSRVFPCNIFCLFLTVIGMTCICAFVTVRYQTDLVLLAVAATTGVVFICVLLAMTSFDFTSLMLYVLVVTTAVGFVLLIFVINTAFTGTYMKWLHVGILVISTVSSCVVLTMELQMILGGKAIIIDEEDYALGAFMIYTSVIDIFLKILQIAGL